MVCRGIGYVRMCVLRACVLGACVVCMCVMCMCVLCACVLCIYISVCMCCVYTHMCVHVFMCKRMCWMFMRSIKTLRENNLENLRVGLSRSLSPP